MRNNLALKPDRREVDWAVLGRGVRLAKRARAAKAREQCGLALGDTKNSHMGAGLGGAV